VNLVDQLGPTGGWEDGDEQPISDDELTALALAADPADELGPDAVALPLYRGLPSGSLPLSYMPPAMARAVGWRVPVLIGLVLSFLLIDVAGLCFTYGSIVGA
jgi:hypothetical protein